MALYFRILTFVILCLPNLSRSGYPGNFHYRLRTLMREHHEEATRRIENINHIRFVYEGNIMYELGYVMAEIIEKYRRMVENLKKPVMYKAGGVFSVMKQIQYIENLYFEIYHLVNMMHEIPRKYGMKSDMTSQGTAEKVAKEQEQEVKEAHLKIEREIIKRERERKQKLKEMKKNRELVLLGQKTTTVTPTPKNKWWPIDYGWEIDYFWR